MEAAYGVDNYFRNVMSSRLLAFFMLMKKIPENFCCFVRGCFTLLIEVSFLIANLEKFPNGGYIHSYISNVNGRGNWEAGILSKTIVSVTLILFRRKLQANVS